MDLFFDAAAVEKKRRVHFHAFMAEVHERLHQARREANGGSDPVSRVAAEFSRETRLLCFDEFAVSDIADATILARLFSALFAAGVVVVATSNAAPERLYENGRNRDLFLPFIALLQERMEVVQLDARADFRAEKRCAREVFFVAVDPVAEAAAQARLDAHMGDGPFEPATLRVKGRDILIPLACGGLARFDFAEICGRPLGAADYHALAENFDKIIVDNVPAMTFDRRDEARRFITLVDVLYETKTKLIICAQVEAGAPLPRRSRRGGAGVSPHGVAAQRDALGGLSRRLGGAAPSPEPEASTPSNSRRVHIETAVMRSGWMVHLRSAALGAASADAPPSQSGSRSHSCVQCATAASSHHSKQFRHGRAMRRPMVMKALIARLVGPDRARPKGARARRAIY